MSATGIYDNDQVHYVNIHCQVGFQKYTITF